MGRLPHIAILGRPNVGKSTLFNRLVGQRQAIVDSTPGVTRDRIEGEFEWDNRRYLVSDLAGWDESPSNPFATETVNQIKKIVERADVIILLVDGKEGITSWDKDLAERLRPAGNPILVVVNKCDTVQSFSRANDFFELGLGDPIPVSATHNLNIDELLDTIASLTENILHDEEPESEETAISVSILGKQNVGKSTLFNALVKDHRAIVSEIPGTTRDSIDTVVEVGGTKFLFIDTAGLKKRSKIVHPIDFYATRRTERTLDRCEIVLLLIDCTQGVTETDTRIAGLIEEKGCSCILVASKWDMTKDTLRNRKEFEKHLRKTLHSIWFAPVCFTSGLNNKGVDDLYEVIKYVHAEYYKRVPTAAWNQALAEAISFRPPPSMKGKQLKLNYITQVETGPPAIMLFVNRPAFLKKPYKRYLEKHFRLKFGFEGTPIIFRIRHKNPEKK